MSDLIASCQSLIQLNSAFPEATETRVAEYVVEYCRSVGIEANCFEFITGRPTVIATIPGQSKSSICLSAHMDTVPFVEADWSIDPLGGKIVEGRLYGRGACDMKSGLGVMLQTFGDWARSSQVPTHTLHLVLTASEEDGCRGAHYLIEKQLFPESVDLILVSEPTVNAGYWSHKGGLWVSAQLPGERGHASVVGSGRNAIHHHWEGLSGLMTHYSESKTETTGVRLNITRVRSGDVLNIIPDQFDVGFDIRLSPGISKASVLDTLQTYLPDAQFPTITYIPALLPPDSATLTKWNTVWAECEIPIHSQPLPYVTDAAFLSQSGRVPTLILGPGDPRQAHTVDEWIALDQIESAYQQYSRLLKHLLSH